MNSSFPHQDLKVWQEALNLCEQIYITTKKFPQSELHGLTNQLRRAAISVGLNIAEGKGRYYDKEFVRFLYISRGSLYEVIACLELSLRLEFIIKDEYDKLFQQSQLVQKLTNGLINALK